MTRTIYKLPADASLVPANQTGLYWFGLSIPAPHEVGLGSNSSAEEREKAQIQLSAILDRFSRVYCESELSGLLRDKRHSHLSVAMDVTAIARRIVEPSHFLNPWLGGADDTEVFALLSALRRISASLPPIYVGLAYDQSLSDRLSDHLDGRSNLQFHLSRSGLQWQDLYYTCITIESLDKNIYRLLEKTLQSLYRPVFSNR
jgi:hypothetical protein